MSTRSLRTAGSTALWSAVVLCAGCATAPRFAGPAPVRNQHPAQLTVGRLLPRSAAATPTGRVRVDWTNAYTSLFLGGTDGRTTYRMDGELWRSAALARAGLGSGFDLEVELPVLHSTSGFLDDFVIGWHDAFSLPDQGRDDARRDGFGVRATRDGEDVWELERSSLELLDVPVALAWTPIEAGAEGPFGLTLRAGVEVPTGDADSGFGSGGFDWMLGAAAELRLEDVSFTAHAQHSFASTPSRTDRAGLSFRDVTVVGAGVELPVTNRLSLLLQTDYETSTLRGLDYSRVSDPQWLLWGGGRYHFGDASFVDFAIGEDLSRFIAPDFSAWLSVSTTF